MVTLRRSFGLSLIEVIVATLILLMAFVVVARLFDAGLRVTGQTDSQLEAVTLAQNTLAEIRDWASRPQGVGYEFDDWTVWNGYTASRSGYTVSVDVADAELVTPASRLETPFVDPRRMPSTTKRVEVSVNWGSGRQLRLASLVSEPARPWGTPAMKLTPPGSAPLEPDETAEFSVQAFDAGGAVITDMSFRWYVRPLNGSATITELDRFGRTARLQHRVMLPDGSFGHAPGRVQVVARALYRGQERMVLSEEVTLNP